MIWHQVFLTLLISGFVGTSSFDEVFLTEKVISGSRFTTDFDQIFHHILIGLIFLTFFFYDFVSR